MSTESEMNVVRRAAVLDLLEIFGFENQKSYTSEEIRKIMLAYLKGKENSKEGA